MTYLGQPGSVGQGLTVGTGGAPAWAAPSVGVGPYSSRPTATAGATYYPTDGWCHYVGDGTTWRPVVGGVAGTQPPAASTFTAVNMSATSTLTDNNGALVASDNTGNDYRIWVKSLGAATIVEACVNLLPPLDGWAPSGPMPFCGIVMRESSTGKTASAQISWNNGGPAIIGFEYGSSSARIGMVQGTYKYAPITTANLFLRLRISGSNLIAEYSGGLGSFFSIATALTLTTAFTSSPDQYGLIVWSNGSGAIREVVPHLATY